MVAGMTAAARLWRSVTCSAASCARSFCKRAVTNGHVVNSTHDGLAMLGEDKDCGSDAGSHSAPRASSRRGPSQAETPTRNRLAAQPARRRARAQPRPAAPG
eukprot:387513-Prymnesium_polylepis.1